MKTSLFSLSTFLFALLFSDATLACGTTGTGNGLDGAARPFVWIALGFPTSADYDACISGTSDRNLLPQGGLVGRMNTIRTTIVNAVVASPLGVTSCQGAPASGTITTGMTFATPAHSAPTGWPKTGAYDKRVNFSGLTDSNGNSLEGFFEFFCDYDGAMAMIVTKSGSTEINRQLVYYDGSSATNKHIDFYMWDHGAISFTGSGNMQLAGQLRVLSGNTYRISITRTGDDGSGNLSAAYRVSAHGNFATQEGSFVFYDRSNDDSGSAISGLVGTAPYTSVSVTAANVPNVSCSDTSVYPCGGCASSWIETFSSIGSSTFCTGLAPTAPAAPAFDATGSLSFAWILQNLKTKLQATN